MQEADENNKSNMENWLNKLNTLTTQDELIITCKDIYQNFNAQNYHSNEYNALNHGLLQHFGRALDLLTIKILSKAQAKISITNIDVLLSIQAKLDSYEKVIMLYGFFNSCKQLDKNVGRAEMFALCFSLLIESAKKSKEEENEYLFLLSVENLISYFKFYGAENESIECLAGVWEMIDLHMETAIQGVRDRLLSLFAKLVKNDTFATRVLLPSLLRRPWNDKNKFYLLAELIDEQNYSTLMGLNDPNLRDENFFNGICLSLKYRHLFSPSQAIVKILLKQEVPKMRTVIAEMFVNGSFLDKKYMIEHWSAMWNVRDKEAIFSHICSILDVEKLIQDAKLEHEAFVNLVLMRSLFSKQILQFDQNSIVDSLIQDKWANLAGSRFVEAHVYEIIVENIVADRNSLEFLKNFISVRYEVQDSAFRQNLVKKLPQMLLHLMKIGIDKSDVRQFLLFLQDEIFLPGIQSQIYQAQIFAIKLLQTFCVLFFDGKCDNPKKSNDLQFGQLLIKENLWNVIHDETYHIHLVTLACNSHFDDVRALTYDILTKYMTVKYTYNEDVYQSEYPQYHTKLLIHISDKEKNFDLLIDHFKTALKVTENSLQQMKNDPLNAVKNEINLYKPLDCLNAFLNLDANLQLEMFESDGELIEVVKCVSDVIIDLINSKEQGLDFSKLDENLEALVAQSNVKSTNIDKDKKLLLHSFWHTLRACSEVAANYGIYVIKNRDQYAKPMKRLLFCSDIIINILVFCCHKGSIESASNAIGRLFNYFTKNWIKQLQSYAEEEIESISNAYMNKILRPLDKIQTLDIRCNRGLILLHMQVLKNDMTIGRTMRQQCLKIFIERLTNLSESDEPKPMVPFLISLFLHDLSKYFNDTELTDDVIPFLEQIILISFSYIRSCYWNIKNASLTLFGSLIPKIMKQKPKLDNSSDEWQHFVSIHLEELVTNMPKVNCHILSELQTNLPTSSIVLYLEFLSNIEVKDPNDSRILDITYTYRARFWKLLGNKSDKVRRLAALCFTQFHHYHDEIPRAVIAYIPYIFQSSCSENFKHGLILAINYLMKKLHNYYQFIDWPEKDAFNKKLKTTFINSYKHDDSSISYYTRCYLLKLLLFLGFQVEDRIIRWVLYERPARNYFGYHEWNNLVTEILENEKSILDMEKDVSMDEISISFSEAL
uniref:CSON001046 protein n=1 Tax=Culicoides sonorensis TaxID=179676 RepID=A0A336LQL3_CULSO